MTTKIEKKIKSLFGTKEAFCAKQGYPYKDFAKRLRAIHNKIDVVNKFVKPLGLELKIIEKGEEKDGI